MRSASSPTEAPLHRQCDGHGGDLAEMEVGAHVRGGAGLGLAAFGAVAAEGPGEIAVHARLGLGRATLEAADGTDGLVALQVGHQLRDVGEVERWLDRSGEAVVDVARL